MTNAICKSQVSVMEKFDNLFIELTAKNCNQKCKNCYINFPQYKKNQDFISQELIEKELSILSSIPVKCIYLTGAEPMTHPDFNSILRLCLNKTNVCICTNGSTINEKKARFLKKVENETKNEIFFEISLDHYNEQMNDEVRYRGAYRHALFAVKYLSKYNFNPIIHTVNYYNETEENLFNEFCHIFSEIGYELDTKHLKITASYDKSSSQDMENINPPFHFDCNYGRVLSAKGIYSCPFLSDDFRGRCGSSFEDFSKNVPLETDFCSVCIKSGQQVFGINWSNFE